jgi:hypothetical protein
MESMYFPAATVFNPTDPHSETARLTLARRFRQFAEERTSRSAAIGTIDVRIMDDAAIASYPYDFRQSSIGKDGSQVDFHAPFSCATQIFLRDKGGDLRIAHEHFSSAEPGTRTQGPPQASIPEAMKPRTSIPAGPRTPSGGSLPATDSAFAEQVRSELKKLWREYQRKNREGIERMFSPTAMTWIVGAKRSISSRLMVAQKVREILGPQSAVNADLGAIEVQALSRNVAVAVCGFHYWITVVQRHGKRADTGAAFEGKRFMIDFPYARETEVFERDQGGTLQIVHSHMSSAGIPTYTELPVTEAEIANVF